MRLDISCRVVIAVLAAGAALNVLAIAMTAMALPEATIASYLRPDVELLDLGGAAMPRSISRTPPARPGRLRVRSLTGPAGAAGADAPSDTGPPQASVPRAGETDTICEHKRNDFHNEPEVDYLRQMPIRNDDTRAGAAEIIAAWDRARGLPRARIPSWLRRRKDSLLRDCGRSPCDRRPIVAARATTLYGLAVRARTSPASSWRSGRRLPSDRPENAFGDRAGSDCDGNLMVKRRPRPPTLLY